MSLFTVWGMLGSFILGMEEYLKVPRDVSLYCDVIYKYIYTCGTRGKSMASHQITTLALNYRSRLITPMPTLLPTQQLDIHTVLSHALPLSCLPASSHSPCKYTSLCTYYHHVYTLPCRHTTYALYLDYMYIATVIAHTLPITT